MALARERTPVLGQVARERKAILGHVSAHWIHHDQDDTCMVEVICLGTGGSARSLVKCLFTGDKAHVPTTSIRP